MDLTREKRQLEDKVEALERTLNLKEKLAFKEPFYYLEGDKTPYCPGCWEDKRAGVHLTFTGDYSDSIGWRCPVCKHYYDVPKGRSVTP